MPTFKLDSTKQIWFTSDTHAYHKNMVRGVSTWPNGYRDFDTVDKMNDVLVKGINDYVGQDDILIHLGDWSFDGIDKIVLFRDRIICSHIHLILGNHDHHIDNDKYDSNDVKLQSLFDSTQHYMEAELGKMKFCFMHYPIRNWNDRPRKSLMFHGHTHGNIEELPNSMDIGVDVAFKLFGEYRPFRLEEAIKLTKTANKDIWGQ